MDSHGSTLSLSRSPSSTSAFAPGPHRRSHPNLQHLSLAPLTPKYPINPSDYDAYFDPATSELHTSSSLSQIVGLPSPGGILSSSPARSRATSRTRTLKRKNRSTVAFKTLEDQEVKAESERSTTNLPRGALTSQGFGGNIPPVKKSARNLHLQINTRKADPDWLVQTGLALTEGSRESKGQSWLIKRASSTSLSTPPPTEEYRLDENIQERQPFKSPYASGRNTPNRSRRSSRDRRRSRRELAMTPAVAMSPTTPRNAGSFIQNLERTGTDDPMHSTMISTHASGQGLSGPDWADSQTQAEIAAELAAELDASEALYPDEEQEGEWWREDRYGGVDFDGHWDVDDDEGGKQDEADVQRAVRERGFGVGRWVDGIVDVFLKLEGDDAEEEQDAHVVDHIPGAEADSGTQEQSEDATEGLQQSRRKMTTESTGQGADDSIEPAPENPKSAWDDIAWFSRLVLRTAAS